jgi:AraC-like DNA-binding protein
MDIQLSGLILFNVISCVFGFVVSVILWRYPRQNNYFNRLLAASFLFLTLGQSIGILVETKAILKVPHIFRLGNLFALLFMPLSWMYLRGVVRNRKLQWKDAVHLIPALLYVIDYFPFFISSAEVKRQVILQHIGVLTNILKYHEGWIFPPWFHLWFRNLLIFGYWLLEIRILFKIFHHKNRELVSENRAWITWLTVSVSLQLFLFSPFFIAVLDRAIPYWDAITFGSSVVLTFTAVNLFLQPIIISGIRGWIIPLANGEALSHHQTNGHILYIGEEKLKSIDSQLNDLMNIERPFLKPGYALIDLANDLGIPLYQVSFFLNNEKGKSFHDMLNEYRINYSRDLMITDHHRQLTLEAIAFESGFGNRNSFTNAFKKFTGNTPSAYMKEIKQNGSNGHGTNGNGSLIHK